MAKVSSQLQERCRDIMNRKQSLVTLGLCAVVALVLLTAVQQETERRATCAPGTAATSAPARHPIRPTTDIGQGLTNDCFRFMMSLHLSWSWDETFAHILPRAALSASTGRLCAGEFSSCWFGCAPWLQPHAAALPE